MLSGKNGQSKWIGYFDRNIFHVDFPYLWKFKEKRDLKSFLKKFKKKKFKKDLILKEILQQFYLKLFKDGEQFFIQKNITFKNQIILCQK